MAQQFGGIWTEKKLESVRRYLAAYTTALKDKPFHLVYIDAFAGTGYREQKLDLPENVLFPELAGTDSQKLLEGSARVALRVDPQFDEYFFVEQDAAAFEELQRIKSDFPHMSDRINLRNEDANDWLRKACNHKPFWRNHRAVVFLDPFGMQVDWTTIQAIASTQAIDLLILFPLGVAVNRLLKKNGDIDESWRARLNSIFGTEKWFDVFYSPHQDLFGEVRNKKIVNLEGIGRYYNERLDSVFARVASNPKPLYNSTGNPLYLLCFAASNPKGAPTALRIAKHILSM